MKITWKEDKYGIIGISFFSVIMLAIALLTHGTGDEGDSIYHYLFARYADVHPEHFFNHWAKPFYTTVAFPFAHFGFMGVKLMNTAFTCIAVWYTYLIARVMKYKWAPAVFVIAIFFKLFMIVSFSGLTEPLHDMMISIAIYLAFTRRYAWAAVILSFLPFVRSEGLFLCGAFSIYFLLMRQWRVLPLLALGHIVYSIAGYPYYHDLLWVFNRIPYARIDPHYGHGHWLSFVRAMPYITAPVDTVLLSVGVLVAYVSAIYLLLKRRWTLDDGKPLFLTFLFSVFFMMHTTFWALGLFGSFGMTRVFIAIGSVMILIMLSGLEFIDDILTRFLKYHSYILGTILIATYLLFASGHTPFSYSKIDFGLHPDQVCDVETANLIEQMYPDRKEYRYFFDARYLGELLDVDVFDMQKYRSNDERDSVNYPPKSIVVWDDWYSKFEHNTPLEKLQANPSIREVKTFQKDNPWGGTRTVVLFVRE